MNLINFKLAVWRHDKAIQSNSNRHSYCCSFIKMFSNSYNLYISLLTAAQIVYPAQCDPCDSEPSKDGRWGKCAALSWWVMVSHRAPPSVPAQSGWGRLLRHVSFLSLFWDLRESFVYQWAYQWYFCLLDIRLTIFTKISSRVCSIYWFNIDHIYFEFL